MFLSPIKKSDLGDLDSQDMLHLFGYPLKEPAGNHLILAESGGSFAYKCVPELSKQRQTGGIH
jgi:hypothetical protein